MTVDFSEMSEQVKGCINSGFYGGGRTCVRVAFKYLIATDEPANEGTFRPVKMILPEGKLISAEATAAMGLYSIPFPTVIDCIIKALEPALPERVTGAHFGTFSSLSFGGKRIDTGAVFKANDSGHGGWGACATHDGAGPFRTMAHGDTRLIPIELQESMYPFRVEEFRLRQDSGGAGQMARRFGFRQAICSARALRAVGQLRPHRLPALGRARREGRQVGPGADLSRTAARSRAALQNRKLPAANRRPRAHVHRRRRRLRRSDNERPVELVARDVVRGFVSIESARDDYGVVFDANGKAREERMKDQGSEG